jgi:hypothetical protein
MILEKKHVLIALIILLAIIVTYLYYSKADRFTLFVLTSAYTILLIYYISLQQQYVSVEKFTDASTATAGSSSTTGSSATAVTKINLEDNIASSSAVAANTVAYLSAFNKNSYGGSGRTWTNLAKADAIKGGCSTPTSAVNWTFDTDPSYTRQAGFVMNTQSITGPLSCALGISCHTPYSVAIAFKPRDVTVAGTSAVEIFKLFANATNNTGLSLVIPANSIKTTSTAAYTTTGLVVKIADKEYVCTFSGSPDIPVDKDLLSMLFITKDTETLTVIYMNEKSATQTTLLSVRDPAILGDASINFSNKELAINATKNWNVNLLSLGIYKAALSSQEIGEFYSKFSSFYKRNRDDEYVALATSYNRLADTTEGLKACPYDAETCGACTDVADWRNTIGLLISAPPACKKAINNYCANANNLDDAKCGGCWNTKNALYNSDACKTTRSLLAKPEDVTGDIIAGLTPAQLEALKSKMGMGVAVAAAAGAGTGTAVAGAALAASENRVRIRDFYPKGTQMSTGGEVDEKDLPGVDQQAGGLRGFFKRLFAGSAPADV